MPRTKIGIVGTGAIGSVMAYYFTCDVANHQIASTDPTSKILTFVRSKTKTATFNTITSVNAENYPLAHQHDVFSLHSLCAVDLLIVPVKCYQVAALIAEIKDLISPTTVIFLLQNGMGGIEAIQEQLPEQPLLVGTTTDAAYQSDVAHYQQTAIGKLDFGWVNLKTLTSSQQALIEKLILANHPQPILHTDIRSALFHKLAINALINPLCTIKDVNNGGLLDERHDLHILFMEVWQAYEHLNKRSGTKKLSKASLFTSIEQVILNTFNNSCSMREDIKHQRKTEVDGILGYILRNKGQLKLPFIESLYRQIRQLESIH